MNKIFLAAGIFTLICVSLHIYTMEVWIYPKLKDDGFPATPFGDNVQTKKSFRMLWHFFTVDFFFTAAAQFIMALTDWISNPVLLGRFIALHWFAYTLVAFWIAQFQPSQLIRAFQWILLVIIGALTWWGTVG
jgi:hypothetical protein